MTERAQNRAFQAEQVHGVITHLDEVLTMSSRMAAATGDLQWEQRYRRAQPQLESAISKAVQLVGEAHSSQGAAVTDAANARLIEMEDRAFDLVRQGRIEEAREIVGSEGYARQKQIYADGMKQFSALLREQIGAELVSQQRKVRWQLVTVVIFFGVLLVAWVMILQTMRQWQTALLERNREISLQVEQATENLTMQNKKLEKTLRRVRKMQDQIIVQEKLASLGSLTAGIAHEIKNPLNFVKNFAELSVDLVEDLRKELTMSKDKIGQARLEELEEVVGDLESNVASISKHSKRADTIVDSMLQHSRGESGNWQLTDINALLSEYVSLAYHGLRAKDSNFNITIDSDLDETLKPGKVVPQDLARALLNIVNHCCPVKSRIESIGWGHRGIRFGSRMAGVPVKGAFFRIA